MAIATVFKSNIERALTNELTDTVAQLDTGFTTAIESPRYGWPGSTMRRSGEVAGTTRNIVDEGDFRDSQEYQFINPFLVKFSWGGGNVHYAPQIFFGYTTRSGNVFPPRNPVEETFKVIDPTELFAENVRRYAA